MKMIFRSLFVIAAVAAVAGAGTYAWFSDAETTSAKVTAGTLILKLDETGKLPVIMENAYPGMIKSTTFSVKNDGSLGGHLQITPSSNQSGEHDITLCPQILATIENMDLAESDDNHYLAKGLSIVDLANGVKGNVALTAHDSDNIKITFTVAPETNDNFQGDTCEMDFDIKLVQDVDQDAIADEDETVGNY